VISSSLASLCPFAPVAVHRRLPSEVLDLPAGPRPRDLAVEGLLKAQAVAAPPRDLRGPSVR
jgi:hypothetical protein